jgi:CysZ protein
MAPMANALATTPRPAARPGFGAGLRAFFGGLGFVARNPSVWPLALVPVLIAATLTSVLAVVGVSHVPGWVAGIIGPMQGTLGSVLGWLAQLAAAVLAVLLAFVVGFGLAQPLSGPVLERLVRRVEATMGAPTWPPTSTMEDIGRSLQTVVVGYAFALPALATLFVIGALFPPAAVVTVPLKILVTALMLAWDVCDYPLSIRGVSVGTRVAFMKRNAAAMVGFGAALVVVGFVPCLLLFVLPCGVAGATRLIHDIERFEGHRTH